MAEPRHSETTKAAPAALIKQEARLGTVETVEERIAALESDIKSLKSAGRRSPVMATRLVPAEIAKQLKNWWWSFWFWNITHYGLGLFATVFSIIAVAKKLPPDSSLPIAIAVATAAVTFLKSSAKANAYIQAWRQLHAEVVIFELDTAYTEAALGQAHKDAEAIIKTAD